MKEEVRLYHYFHVSRGYGLPFALCDKHEKEYNPPAKSDPNLIFEKISDKALIGCFMCEEPGQSFVEDVID